MEFQDTKFQHLWKTKTNVYKAFKKSRWTQRNFFPNVKASDGWIDKMKKGKEKYTNTVNKKFIFLNQHFTDIFASECVSLCNHFMLVCCFNISTMEFFPDMHTLLCLTFRGEEGGVSNEITRAIIIKIT